MRRGRKNRQPATLCLHCGRAVDRWRKVCRYHHQQTNPPMQFQHARKPA